MYFQIPYNTPPHAHTHEHEGAHNLTSAGRGARRRAAARAGGGARSTAARKVLGWPKICELAHAFLWECSCKRLKLAQLLGQLGVVFTCCRCRRPRRVCNHRRHDARPDVAIAEPPPHPFVDLDARVAGCVEQIMEDTACPNATTKAAAQILERTTEIDQTTFAGPASPTRVHTLFKQSDVRYHARPPRCSTQGGPRVVAGLHSPALPSRRY